MYILFNCAVLYLGEPHTSGTVLRNPLVYTVYASMVHTSPPSPALWANVSGSMMSFNNSMYEAWLVLSAASSHFFYTHLMKLRKGKLGSQ